jgi:hypothetical protein
MKWEYQVLILSIGECGIGWTRNAKPAEDLNDKIPSGILNMLGRDGWELVSVLFSNHSVESGEMNQFFYFKRPLP